jgi:hypothetical protein
LVGFDIELVMKPYSYDHPVNLFEAFLEVVINAEGDKVEIPLFGVEASEVKRQVTLK